MSRNDGPEYRKAFDFVKYFAPDSAAIPDAADLTPQQHPLTEAERPFTLLSSAGMTALIAAYAEVQNELQSQIWLMRDLKPAPAARQPVPMVTPANFMKVL